MCKTCRTFIIDAADDDAYEIDSNAASEEGAVECLEGMGDATDDGECKEGEDVQLTETVDELATAVDEILFMDDADLPEDEDD